MFNVKRLNCKVEIGQWGIMSGITGRVVGFGEIVKAAPIMDLLIGSEHTNSGERKLMDRSHWNKRNVEIFNTKGEAHSEFLKRIRNKNFLHEK